MTLERLKLVLQEKTRFITRLLSILETYHNAVTQLPLGAWDAISDGDFVPPHAHLMMVLEAKGWRRVGRGWVKSTPTGPFTMDPPHSSEDWFIPLWWVWGIGSQSIVWDVTKMVALLESTAKKHQDLATDEDWLEMLQESL